jgi:hypothetical protein
MIERLAKYVALFVCEYLFPENEISPEVTTEEPSEEPSEDPSEVHTEEVQSLYSLVSSWSMSDTLDSDDDVDEHQFSPIGTIVAHWTLSDEAIELL